MKVSFYSNFLNHHQLPFCLEMTRLLGDDFKFIATEPTHQERLDMGYHDMNEQYDFCICSYKDEKSHNNAIKLGSDSDVVIIGSAPDLFIAERLRKNKLTFRYSERLFKKGILRLLNPRLLASVLINHTRHRNKNLYMLCASAYTAYDVSLIGAYPGKTYKWGYFPQVIEHEIDELMANKQNHSIRLLWCGRFIDWKHPELPIMVAKKLKEEGYSFHLNFIGKGPLENDIKNMCINYGLEDCITFLGVMSPEQVREHMESANIFLFTSDFNEGWGAVLNESMNSACAVVASHAIGSVPFLIRHKENGMIYKNGSLAHLYECIKYLLDDEDECCRLGLNAYNTLKRDWNAQEAAKRFIELSESLLNGKEFYYDEDICSKTEKISHRYKY